MTLGRHLKSRLIDNKASFFESLQAAGFRAHSADGSVISDRPRDEDLAGGAVGRRSNDEVDWPAIRRVRGPAHVRGGAEESTLPRVATARIGRRSFIRTFLRERSAIPHGQCGSFAFRNRRPP